MLLHTVMLGRTSEARAMFNLSLQDWPHTNLGLRICDMSLYALGQLGRENVGRWLGCCRW